MWQYCQIRMCFCFQKSDVPKRRSSRNLFPGQLGGTVRVSPIRGHCFQLGIETEGLPGSDHRPKTLVENRPHQKSAQIRKSKPVEIGPRRKIPGRRSVKIDSRACPVSFRLVRGHHRSSFFFLGRFPTPQKN